MSEQEDRDREEKIEKAIYYRADLDQGFAIAYALIQCAAAINRLADEIGGAAAMIGDLDAAIRSNGTETE